MSTSWEMNKTLAEADSFVDELLTFTVAAASSRSPRVVDRRNLHGEGRRCTPRGASVDG
jgi:hypothetical protein